MEGRTISSSLVPQRTSPSSPSRCFDCKPRLEAPHPQERNQGLLPDPLYQPLLYHSHQDSPACLTCPSSVRAWASIGCKLPSMADGFNCFWPYDFNNQVGFSPVTYLDKQIDVADEEKKPARRREREWKGWEMTGFSYLAPGECCKLAAAVRESPRVTGQWFEY